MLDVFQQIFALLGNPEQVLSSLPNPVTWPTLVQDALRSYRIHVIAYNLGLLLMLAGAASSVVGVMTGVRSWKVFVNLFAVAVLWPLLTLPPANDCLPNSGYPCTVQKRVELVNPSSLDVEYVREDLDFSVAQVSGGGTVWTIPNRERFDKNMVKVEKEGAPLPPYVRYEYTTPLPPLWKGVEDLWWGLAQGANYNLMSSLLRYREGVADFRSKALWLFTYAFAFNSAASLADEVGNLATFALIKGRNPLGRVAGGVGTLATGAGTMGAGMVAETFKVVAATLAVAPVALIVTYGFVISMSGFALYAVIYLFPLVLGIASVFGLGAIAFPLRLALVSLLVPVITSPLVGTAVQMTYGYNQSIKSFLETSTKGEYAGLMEQVGFVNNPAESFVGSTAVQMAAKQLLNTYACLEPLFNKKIGGGYEYVGYRSGPVRLEGITTCYAPAGSGFLWIYDRPPSGQPGTPLSKAMSSPIAGLGKGADVKEFFADLSAYTLEGKASLIDLTSPSRLKNLRNLINRYGIHFYVPGGGLSGLLPDLESAVKARMDKNAASKLGSLDEALNHLAQPVPPDLLTEKKNAKYTRELAQYAAASPSDPSVARRCASETGGNACLLSSPVEVSYVLDRFLLANEMGLDETSILSGGLAQAALSVFVSGLVSLVLSLIVIGSVWGLMGAAFGATVGGLEGVVEAPGLGILANQLGRSRMARLGRR